MSEETNHPGPKQYGLVAIVLCLITLFEFWAFYIEWLEPVFVPLLLVLSALKFLLVCMFYMHLRYDHKLFQWLLAGCMLIGFGVIAVVVALFAYSHPLGMGS